MGAVRLLSEADVHHLVTPLEAQHVVEQTFRDFGNGISRMAARVTVPIPEVGGNFRILPAVKVLATPRVMPLKNLDRDRFTVMLYDYRDGALLAIVAARWLGAIRTGATSAVATRYMARPMGADWP